MTEIDIVKQGRLKLNGYHPRDIVDTTCPIDGTQLVPERGYDFHHYRCVGCGARYSWPVDAVLDEEARRYLKDVAINLAEVTDQKNKLEAILKLGIERGLAEDI